MIVNKRMNKKKTKNNRCVYCNIVRWLERTFGCNLYIHTYGNCLLGCGLASFHITAVSTYLVQS